MLLSILCPATLHTTPNRFMPIFQRSLIFRGAGYYFSKRPATSNVAGYYFSKRPATSNVAGYYFSKRPAKYNVLLSIIAL